MLGFSSRYPKEWRPYAADIPAGVCDDSAPSSQQSAVEHQDPRLKPRAKNAWLAVTTTIAKRRVAWLPFGTMIGRVNQASQPGNFNAGSHHDLCLRGEDCGLRGCRTWRWLLPRTPISQPSSPLALSDTERESSPLRRGKRSHPRPGLGNGSPAHGRTLRRGLLAAATLISCNALHRQPPPRPNELTTND
jgi:hypothetical protein